MILLHFTYSNMNTNIIILMLDRIILFNLFVVDRCSKITVIHKRKKNIIILILEQFLLSKWIIIVITNYGNQNSMVLFLKEINYKI